MKNRNRLCDLAYLISVLFLWQGISFNAFALDGNNEDESTAGKIPKPEKCRVLTADRLFDGFELHDNWAVLLRKEKVAQTGPVNEIKKLCNLKNHLGNATILPGFIESHAHITFQSVRKDKVLEHGITTAQDTGGPLLAPTGGEGRLRLLSVGPILQAPGGYPLNIFGGGAGGYDQIGYPVSSADEAQEVVQHLVDGGATAIKIALEPGGETGAPWMQPHDGPVPSTPWPLLSEEIVQAIVAKAHSLDKRVIAHVGENIGFDRALSAGRTLPVGIDEFAHMPCSEISEGLLQEAVDQGITFVTTIDTLSSCVDSNTHKGIHSNTMSLADKGAIFIYGSEVAHDNVPWGINGEEMRMMLHLTSGASIDFMDVLNVFKAATSKAGENLGNPLLGTLSPNAPADLIAVRGNPFERFKLLEYPDLVISGGRVIVNHFKK